MKKMKLSVGLLFLTFCAVRARAYVTSAILEYSVDDKVGISLNGNPILEKSDFAPFNYEVLSTSDGTLPMEFFNGNGDNTLAVEDFDVEGYNMSVSYRFTIHLSDGDPIEIWSVPAQAKMLHLHKEGTDPEGWKNPGFDDSSWGPAVEASMIEGNFDTFPQLYDPSFGGAFSINPFVPRLSHIFNMNCQTADRNLFRSHFKFYDHPAKVTPLINPAQAVVGQQVAVRLIPGPDTAELSQFNILAWLPRGLDPTSVSRGGQWNQQLRRIAWSFGAKDLDVRYAKMGVQSVLDASGWQNPEKVIGLEKPGKARRQLNIPASIWNDGAVFTANHPAWFRMDVPHVDLTTWRPMILGVIFHSQLREGGTDYNTTKEADEVFFNYSVDGTDKPALKKDIQVSRMTTSDYWYDGYYDATEDRHWTWEDLDQLRARINCHARGTVDNNLLSSIVVTVKYYTPAKASPYFYAKVTDPRCATLQLQTGVYKAGSPMVASDPVNFPINQQLCAPTPVPTPTTQPPPPVMPTPEPTHVPGNPGLKMHGNDVFHLACLAADPEPLNFAGTYVSFCIQKPAHITLNVYAATDGKLVRTLDAGDFRPGASNQIFFDALNDQHTLLPEGAYIIELVAEANGSKEVRNTTIHIQSARH